MPKNDEVVGLPTQKNVRVVEEAKIAEGATSKEAVKTAKANEGSPIKKATKTAKVAEGVTSDEAVKAAKVNEGLPVKTAKVAEGVTSNETVKTANVPSEKTKMFNFAAAAAISDLFLRGHNSELRNLKHVIPNVLKCNDKQDITHKKKLIVFYSVILRLNDYGYVQLAIWDSLLTRLKPQQMSGKYLWLYRIILLDICLEFAIKPIELRNAPCSKFDIWG
ncbi:Hypothetical predicted protein [Octopus vulgaris]|uniref:Uncharacterized protein n=1 Tax=Octopus vulgaris TaxID=6645 RepID=A0AA36F0K1_OCTVU|nr:Hypothetical predicted protein [Octopus vulgaris]